MNKPIIISFICALCIYTNVGAQENLVKVFTSKFVSQNVTYNASPNPNECWEAVEWGIKIKDGKHESFFTLNYQEIEKLKSKIGEEDVQIAVVYYDEASEGGATGMVSKITLKGEVLFEHK